MSKLDEDFATRTARTAPLNQSVDGKWYLWILLGPLGCLVGGLMVRDRNRRVSNHLFYVGGGWVVLIIVILVVFALSLGQALQAANSAPGLADTAANSAVIDTPTPELSPLDLPAESQDDSAAVVAKTMMTLMAHYRCTGDTRYLNAVFGPDDGGQVGGTQGMNNSWATIETGNFQDNGPMCGHYALKIKPAGIDKFNGTFSTFIEGTTSYDGRPLFDTSITAFWQNDQWVTTSWADNPVSN